jgi:hypothetical protein
VAGRINGGAVDKSEYEIRDREVRQNGCYRLNPKNSALE